MKYLYKHIEVYQSYGTWQADYNDGQTRLALHRACTRTKRQAEDIAKEEVDYLNGKVTT